MFNRNFIRHLSRYYKLLNRSNGYFSSTKDRKPLQLCLRVLHHDSIHYQQTTYLIDEKSQTNHNVNDQEGCNKFTGRTHNCSELRSVHVGQNVILCGWLEYQRMSKFVVIRDGYGHTQLLVDEKDVETQKLLSSLPYESVIKVEGTVLSRPEAMINNKQATGEIEVLVNSFEVLNEVKGELPFNIREFQRAKENLRLQYRYLDLRFPQMQKNLRMRSKLIMKMRNFLINQCYFVEVETPTLFKTTPGGAQEFIVPTRFPGKFYSLVQSPQQFKQILMAGAIDRYFQVARCYRDEGTRSDRQPEFTQLDIEMSFTDQNGVMKLIEELLEYSWPDSLPPLPHTFPRISFKDALEQYGTDKPDIRYKFLIKNCTAALKDQHGLTSDDFGAHALVFNEPFMSLTKSVKEKLMNSARTCPNVKFIASKISNLQEWTVKISQLLGETATRNCIDILNLRENSVIFMAYGDAMDVLQLLGRIRLEYITILEQQGHELKKPGMHPLWITDFPLFERNETKTALQSAHHPFTAPHLDDVDLLETSPQKVRAQAYDLVLNGNEVGGGSIRIHNPIQQELILKILNIEKNVVQHMIDMLGHGCPPHGGIALGLDRFLATILETSSIRDVIAFPKSHNGQDLLSGAPTPVPDDVQKFYHVQIREDK